MICKMCGRGMDFSESFDISADPGLSKVLTNGGKYNISDGCLICLRCKTLLEIQRAVMDLRPPQHRCGPF